MSVTSEVLYEWTHLVLNKSHYLCEHTTVVEAELLFEDLDVAGGDIQILHFLTEHCGGELVEHATCEALRSFCIM